MGVELGIDFIGRVRQRTHAEEERKLPQRRITVLVTRDGATAEELVFDHPPTLAELVAHAGSTSYVLGIAIEDHPFAAE
ncbi:MAG: hypothetical protein H6895_10555 [Defluviimonas sp.]|uniref:hypothetical protein n=1 Tax=Albidovulum sp. TaxID=1872424 RepID=UPI001DDE38D3|nr:hypothetical protein [Paracoccaceae bacterium]MCC0064512.1 hypothetical protein [Defluviimonas sp.]